MKLIKTLFRGTTGVFRRLYVIVRTFLARKNILKAHRISRNTTNIVTAIAQSAGSWKDLSRHPLHNVRLPAYSESCRDPNVPLKSICFGDSLMDIPRREFTTVPEAVNFAISGSRSHHMKQMAVDLHKVIKVRRRLSEVENIYIGTLEGNGFLIGEPLDMAVSRSLEALATLRKLFSKARIIVNDLPPTYNIWADRNRFPFRDSLFAWVRDDRNAVFITFSQMGKWFPNIWLSDDGVHHTDLGTARFDSAMQSAQTADPGEIVKA